MFVLKSKHNKVVEKLKAEIEEERTINSLKDEHIRELRHDLEKFISKYENSKPIQ